jgi:HK97 family phage portal protein
MFLLPRRADGIGDRSPWGEFWFQPVERFGLAGVPVGPAAALRLSAVFSCVRLLSESFASLPLRFYKRNADGSKTRVYKHWLIQLLTRRPNDMQNAYEFREMLIAHCALRGNAFSEIDSNRDGSIASLTPINPDSVRIDLLDSGSWRYRVKQRDGTDRIIQRGQMWHLRGLSSNGIVGLSPIDLARDNVSIGLATQQFGARFFANDATPAGGWLEYPGKWKDAAQREEFREAWQESQTGRNRGKTPILDQGLKYHGVTVSLEDQQFLETRQFQVDDIARVFRVPPHMIGSSKAVTNATAEQLAAEFISYCMTSWAERYETSVEAELAPESDAIEVEADFANLMRGSVTGRTAYYASGIQNGWLVRNEAREAENFEPIPGLDEPLRPVNMQTEDEAVNRAANPPAPAMLPGVGDTNKGDPKDREDEKKGERLRLVLRSNCERLARRIARAEGVPPALAAEALGIPVDKAAEWTFRPGATEPEIFQSLLALAGVGE